MNYWKCTILTDDLFDNQFEEVPANFQMFYLNIISVRLFLFVFFNFMHDNNVLGAFLFKALDLLKITKVKNYKIIRTELS